MPGLLPLFADVRRGEWRAIAPAFATLLLLITAHTALETVRDALVLTRLPARDLGIVYVAVALCALPAVGAASRAAARFGARSALGGGLVTAAALLVALFAAPMNRATAVAVYVTTGLISSVLVPLYWNLLASILDVAQARRLLGIVGSAGIVGALLGSTAAAAFLNVVHTRSLLLVLSSTLLLTAIGLAWIPGADHGGPGTSSDALPTRESVTDVRDEPFLRRIAILVLVATTASVFVDYFFKWTVSRVVPHHDIARFVARYYVGLNVLSLVAQLFATGALVRRMGLAAAVVVTPMLMLLGVAGTFLGVGTLTAALALKTVDGTLRNSVHRVTVELLYLPVPASVRARVKPFIDGVIARTTQAAAGLVLLALAGANWLSSWLLAGIVGAAILVWLAVAATMRGPYLEFLRHAVTGNAGRPPSLDLDLESAERLVELLAHPDTLVVVGAMSVLARRGRERLIPALVLLHEEEAVLVRALGMFGESSRDDWVGRARGLLADSREPVRTAAARALAMHGRLDAKDLAFDADPRLHAYAALRLSLATSEANPMEDPVILELLARPGPSGDHARLGLLASIADSKAEERLVDLLAALASEAGTSREWTEGLAKAAASQQANALIPQLVSRLASPDTRDAVNAALVSLGPPGLDEVWGTLLDPSRDRELRVHLPSTIARFGSKAAADLLLQCIETEHDGLVRYKAIRGLDRLTAEQRVTVDRVRAERLALANLVEHFRLLMLRAPFAVSPSDDGPTRSTTRVLLVGLLDDKLRQSLERTFRLLKVAHPRDDIHRVHVASQSRDSRARANAAEFLDALLRRRDQGALRQLLLVVADDLSLAERAARGGALLRTAAPMTQEAAIARMTEDGDMALSALASLHAATVAGRPARVALGGGRGGSPVELSTEGAASEPEPSHA